MLNQPIESLKELIKEEGNYKNFIYKDFFCEIKRNSSQLHLCGYIHLPNNHYLYEKEYDEIEKKFDYEIPAHGGLTYSSPSFKNDYWVIGFDAAHSSDVIPAMAFLMNDIFKFTQYKTMDYIESNIMDIIDFIEFKN